MTQLGLFACAVGQHATLIDRDPIDYGEAVNVSRVCSDCGIKVIESSWTKEAWLSNAPLRREDTAP